MKKFFVTILTLVAVAMSFAAQAQQALPQRSPQSQVRGVRFPIIS